MRRLLFFAFLAMMGLGVGLALSCGGDDDDTGDDDGGNIECTIDNLCQWIVEDCQAPPFSDVASCQAYPPTCEDEEGFLNCVCDCMNADPPCEGDGTEDCFIDCAVEFSCDL